MQSSFRGTSSGSVSVPAQVPAVSIISQAEVKTVNAALALLRDLLYVLHRLQETIIQLSAFRDLKATVKDPT
jgi:hypothetical protein